MGLLEERQLASQRSLHLLSGGWPFGDGPLQWNCHLETRERALASPPETHVICDLCGQSVFCLAADNAQRGFTWNLELLKARVADHVLKCHPEAVT